MDIAAVKVRLRYLALQLMETKTRTNVLLFVKDDLQVRFLVNSGLMDFQTRCS